jgi:hypothetical protein
MIVITTPTGQIGGQVILDSGEAARVIARDPSRLPARVHARAEVVQGSHSDADTITKALAGADRMFWLVPPAGFRHAGSAGRYYLDSPGLPARRSRTRESGWQASRPLATGTRARPGSCRPHWPWTN